MYRKHQFVSISWLAAQSGRVLHLVEGEHVIMRQTKSGPEELDIQQYLQNSSNTKDTIYLAFKDRSTFERETLYIQRKVWKNGSVREGIFDSKDWGFGRLLLNDAKVRMGFLDGRNLDGEGVEEDRSHFDMGEL